MPPASTTVGRFGELTGFQNERKSIQPIAERFAAGECDQLHHFIADGVWDAAPLETELLKQADRLVGGEHAVLVIDDTAVPKRGKHSVGVAAQYASALGKTANCQTLVSLTLARGEVPVMIAYHEFQASREFDRQIDDLRVFQDSVHVVGRALETGADWHHD